MVQPHSRLVSVVSDDRGSVTGRLLFAFGVSLLLLLAATVLGQMMRGQIQTLVREKSERNLARDALTDEALHVLEHLRQANLLHVISRSQEQMDAAEQERSRLVAALQGLRRQYGEVVSSPRERELSDSFFTSIDRFISVSEHTIELSRSGRKEEARDWIMERGTPAYLAAEAQGHGLRAYTVAESRQVTDDIHRIHSAYDRRMVLVTALGFAVALLLYIFIVRRITRPLEHLRAAAEQLAAGRLDVADVAVEGPDEIGDLAGSFTKMNRSLRQRFRDMKELVEVGRAVSSSLSLQDLLQIIVERGRVLLDSDHAGICLQSEGENGDKLRTGTFPLGDPLYEKVQRESEAHLRAIHADRRPRVAHDVAGFATALYIPLVFEERTVGAVAFFGREGWEVDGWRLEMADMLAQQAAVATENARLHMELREGCLSTISALAAAVEAKDSYIGAHCDRMAEYGMAVAHHLGLPPDEVELVRQACLLHDSGKIGIRDEVLLKPGRLTEREYGEIKKHPVIGAGIVGSASFLEDVAGLIRHHHEWYDGGGYPDGLKGEDIPLGARIVAVVDAYEAMTSDRPYRKAMTPEQAAGELRRCAGTQFDPAVVEAFLSVL